MVHTLSMMVYGMKSRQSAAISVYQISIMHASYLRFCAFSLFWRQRLADSQKWLCEKTGRNKKKCAFCRLDTKPLVGLGDTYVSYFIITYIFNNNTFGTCPQSTEDKRSSRRLILTRGMRPLLFLIHLTAACGGVRRRAMWGGGGEAVELRD